MTNSKFVGGFALYLDALRVLGGTKEDPGFEFADNVEFLWIWSQKGRYKKNEIKLI